MENFKSIVGGKWWKVDFHLHSPGSYDYGHGNKEEQKTTPREYLQKCMDEELDCIVVTDHNCFNWIPKLRDALEKMKADRVDGFRDIVIFPGIEINVQGNVHLLGIFDPSTEQKSLDAIPYLIHYDPANETTLDSINQVINTISEKNGVAIPAHVDGPSGLFYPGTSPSIQKSALDTGNILALEVIGEKIDNAIIKERGLKLSYVVGSDSHTLETIGSKFTWVKMGEPNIEALRLALFDLEDGVIRYMNYKGNPNDRHGKTYLKSIEIENGKYIGRKDPYKIYFSPWLNSMIGGRGSGKSSILKFMRLVLDRGDELPNELKKEYEDFIKVPANRLDLGMLQDEKGDVSGTIAKIEICVEGVDHTLKWENGEIREFQADTNDWETAFDLKNRFPVRLFSQKQLYEMTKDTGLLFEYLDSQWNHNEWKEKFFELRREYTKTFRDKEEFKEKHRKQEQLNVQLVDVKKKISVFETEKIKGLLLQKEQLQNQLDAISEVYKHYSSFIKWTNGFKDFRDLVIPHMSDCIDDDNNAVLNEWVSRINTVINELLILFNSNQSVLVSFEELQMTLPISEDIEKNSEELNKVIEELRSIGVDDIDRYAELLQEKDRLEKEISLLGDVTQSIVRCEKALNLVKKEWEQLIKYRYEKRNAILQDWNTLSALKLTLIPFGDMHENEYDFRNIIRRDGGAFSKDILDYDEDGNLTKKGILYFMSKETDINTKITELQEMKDTVLKAPVSLGKKFSSYLEKTFNNSDAISELEMWIPKDALKLELNMNKKGKPLYRSIDAGSPGQRTSAILSLILGISTMPIIIDQPEDDLDTRNVTDIVVSSINEMKKRQQIILVTHNPNIVVNTNSEQVIQLDYKNGQIVNACSGALQSHDVRDAICEVMEGGKEALEKRYYRIFKALEK